jgi:indolepyruvate ferredoxin oxidoreductase
MLGYAYQKGWLPVRAESLMKAIELNGVSIAFNQKSFEWGRYAAHDLPAVERMAAPAQVVSIVPSLQRPKSLDDLIAKRVELLTAYQNSTYAQQYQSFVGKVRAEEAKHGLGEKLTEAVAKYLYKLMAYKDEYEVARLYTDPAFKAKLDAQFEPGYSLKFYLAPPLLAKKNDKGELIKQTYGPWMMTFGLLAKMKSLRGTVFDVFGKTDERRMERSLITDYRTRVESLLPKLSSANHKAAVSIAIVPEDIRGYGHVKERNVKIAAEKVKTLLSEFENGGAATGVTGHQTIEIKRVAA